MSPVDSIKAPKKIKKKQVVNRPTVDAEIKIKENSPLNIDDHQKKTRLVWILSISSVVIILLAWILLFDINKLADKDSSDGYWQQVTHKIGNLWDSFKSDILKINNDVVIEDIVTQDEKIKELESQVFPQFEDPTRQ